jgi:hypothetical protein
LDPLNHLCVTPAPYPSRRRRPQLRGYYVAKLIPLGSLAFCLQMGVLPEWRRGDSNPNLRRAKSGDSIPEVSRAHIMPTNKHILPITVLHIFQDIYPGCCIECVPGRTRTCDLLFVVSPTQGNGPRGRDTERHGVAIQRQLPIRSGRAGEQGVL